MCDRITTSAWTDGTLSKKFHHRTPFGETAFCTQDMFAAALRLRTGSRGRVHGDCAQPKTVGKRLLPQLGCVGKMALAWRTRGKNRGKTTSTFSHDSRALEYVFANQVQIVTGAGNGARTRDLNFGKFEHASAVVRSSRGFEFKEAHAFGVVFHCRTAVSAVDWFPDWS
jgi:hypothetical protein